MNDQGRVQDDGGGGGGIARASNGLKGLVVDAYGAYANWKTGALLTHTKDTHGGVDDAAA